MNVSGAVGVGKGVGEDCHESGRQAINEKHGTKPYQGLWGFKLGGRVRGGEGNAHSGGPDGQEVIYKDENGPRRRGDSYSQTAELYNVRSH